MFDHVNRACAVVICENLPPHQNTKTDCFRLTPETRKGILSGSITFAEAEKRLAHSVPQNRFIQNGGNLFDIDVTVSEERILNKLRRSGTTFKSILTNARGVELSKYGRVIKCPNCGNWQPKPNTEKSYCKHCCFSLDMQHIAVQRIVSTEKFEKYQPFIVGECIQRYFLCPSFWIDPDKIGLNYKKLEIYESPKLLVRKTGVGISATIDYTTALTNQVVYIFHLQHNTIPHISLETCLGILNSRLMYYYLVKTHGETEWRSHPYVTQQQILDLPIPFGSTKETFNEANLAGIHHEVKSCCTANSGISPEIDAKIERYVANLFGLSKADYETIYSTLTSVQALLPVRALKSVPINAIFTKQGR